MRTYREEYEYWLSSGAVDENTKEELRALEGNDAEIERDATTEGSSITMILFRTSKK